MLWVLRLDRALNPVVANQQAEAALRAYLARAADRKLGLARLSTDDMLDVAEEAANFITTAYWRRMTVMLDRTIASEFEEMLQGEGSRELNQASIVVARKMLRMPFIDIEQGKAAVQAVERHQATVGRIFGLKRDVARMGGRK
jgi:hypothetical protein